jgi:hypothetical protein
VKSDILFQETITGGQWDGKTYGIVQVDDTHIYDSELDDIQGNEPIKQWFELMQNTDGEWIPYRWGTSASGGWTSTDGMRFSTLQEGIDFIQSRQGGSLDPTDPSTHPSTPRPSPPNGGLGGLGALPTGGSPETASEPSNNPFPSGGSSGGVF